MIEAERQKARILRGSNGLEPPLFPGMGGRKDIAVTDNRGVRAALGAAPGHHRNFRSVDPGLPHRQAERGQQTGGIQRPSCRVAAGALASGSGLVEVRRKDPGPAPCANAAVCGLRQNSQSRRGPRLYGVPDGIGISPGCGNQGRKAGRGEAGPETGAGAQEDPSGAEENQQGEPEGYCEVRYACKVPLEEMDGERVETGDFPEFEVDSTIDELRYSEPRNDAVPADCQGEQACCDSRR